MMDGKSIIDVVLLMIDSRQGKRITKAKIVLGSVVVVAMVAFVVLAIKALGV